jgi:superfamily II DNA or RNA helicase
MMPPRDRRYFNDSERAALYLAADGRCAECGTELQRGWHGDHVLPHSMGGVTDVVNGQALCPTCNLKKGARVSTLRLWQERAIGEFYARNARDFLVSATPGAGKTRFALALAQRLLDEGTVSRVAVIVPTDALRQQWADAAGQAGLALMPVSAIEDYDKPGYVGCVATYAQLAAGVGAALLRRSMRSPTLVVCDEIHHAGDSKSWGESLKHGIEPAVHRLHLTGTPWRRDDREPIPFVTYETPPGETRPKVKIDYAYEYGEAVADGVCRRIEFHAYGGDAKWRDVGKLETAEIGADLSDEDLSVALDAIYHPDHVWMPALLDQAVLALDEIVAEVPDAAGLVIADNQAHAKAYGELLRRRTGQAPVVVVSENGADAKDAIDRFRTSRDRWIVAVRMVSEGVDIPRLAVGVYASKTRTPLFFRQVVGRFVRVRPGEEFNARLLIPAVQVLMEHGRTIELELRHQLDLEEKRERESVEREEGQGKLDLREPISATEAVFDRAIIAGGDVSGLELEDAAEWCRRFGIPASFATAVARGRREDAMVAEPGVVAKPETPRYRREQMLRGEVESLARKLARRMGAEPKTVNIALLRAGFPARKVATVEQLEEMERYLVARLGEAWPTP